VTAGVLQLTDPHIGAEWGGDPVVALRTVIAAVASLPQRPVAALVTGDLTNNGRDDEYKRLASALAELDLPLHVLPGNHDDRAALRRHFDVPGAGAEPIQYAVQFGSLRVLMLDTTRPGGGDGELGSDRLSWLADQLAAPPQGPTLLAMHHPPFRCDVPGMDRYALAAPDREAVARLIAGHPHVQGVIAGHVHRTMTADVGGRTALTIPSTYRQLPLDFEAEHLAMVRESLGFALHTVVDGRLVSHVQTLSGAGPQG
jgi:3',5'-cyclic-AMP phosphodiesterase